MFRFLIVVLLTMVSFVLVQCQSKYKLSSDTTSYFIADGPGTADTVIVILEGGPKCALDFEIKGRAYTEYLNRHKDYLFAVVHQYSTYDDRLCSDDDFTISDAEEATRLSTDMLLSTISYFKKRNRIVIVVGHSYGAFIIVNSLVEGEIQADHYCVTAGRLYANKNQRNFQQRGFNSGFEKDGKTWIKPDTSKVNRFRRSRYLTIRRNIQYLKYPLGINYMEKLKDVDLSKFHFYTGTMDENVGFMTTVEIEFLKNHGATVDILEMDHYKQWMTMIDDLELWMKGE